MCKNLSNDENYNYFTKEYTVAIKGFAIILLLLHHLNYHMFQVPVNLSSASWFNLLSWISKVCVAIFVILSGYGLSESFKKTKSTSFAFVYNHYIKIMMNFWFIFIIFFLLGFVLGENPIKIYGSGSKFFPNFILDFLGLQSLLGTNTLNLTWWYMEAVIVLYIAFPFLYKLCKKIPIILIALAIIPFFVGSIYNDGCREIYWFLPFIIGIILSQKNLLNRFIMLVNNYHFLSLCLSSLLIIITMFLRTQFGLIIDSLLGISLILFLSNIFVLLNKIPHLLSVIGKCSYDIFLTHSFLYTYFYTANFFNIIKPYFIIYYLAILFSSFLLSYLLEKVKKLFNYDKLINKLQK